MARRKRGQTDGEPTADVGGRDGLGQSSGARDDAQAGEATGGKRKGGKRKKLLVALVLVAVVAGGEVTGKLPGLRHGDAAPAKPVPGTVLTLDPITLNLADGHYLKLGLALQMVKEKSSGEAATTTAASEGAKALDLAITRFASTTMNQLLATGGREKAKAQLKEAVVKRYDGKVMDIYFTEFVMQ